MGQRERRGRDSQFHDDAVMVFTARVPLSVDFVAAFVLVPKRACAVDPFEFPVFLVVSIPFARCCCNQHNENAYPYCLALKTKELEIILSYFFYF